MPGRTRILEAGNSLGSLDLEKGELGCGVGREASLLSGPGGIPGPCSAPLPVSGLREFRKPDLALALAL